MTEIRGRHFGFLALLCGGWIAARVAITEPPAETPDTVSIAQQRAGKLAAPTGTHPPDLRVSPVAAYRSAGTELPRARYVGLAPRARSTENHALPDPEIPPIIILAAQLSPMPLAGTRKAKASAPPLWDDNARSRWHGEYYAYSFWRIGNHGTGLASGGQYGGGQGGVIATFARQRQGERQRLALLLRAAVAHADLAEREIAVGIRWQPSPELPLSLTGERRFRNRQTDAFSVYAAGGQSAVALPLKFRLDGFGQAGLVSGKDGGPFFDVIARADRKIIDLAAAPIHAGAGLWAGGQKNVMRVDIGPSLRSDIQIEKSSLRVTADWRFRIAGDARPGNGPAISLSTSF